MTSVAPAQRAAPQMTHTPDHVITPEAQAAVSADDARAARPTLRDQIAANPLLSLFLALVLAVLTFLGTVTVALLIFLLNDINDGLDSLGERIDSAEVALGGRIDGVEMRLGERIDRVEMRLGERIDRVEMRLGERIDRVEMRLGERIDGVEGKVDAGFSAHGGERPG